MIDCHTHLSDPSFDEDREAVLERAREAGVEQIVVVGQDAWENEKVLNLAANDPRMLPCLGLHPDRFADHVQAPSGEEIEQVLTQIRAHRAQLVGIGEVGLDYWVCQSGERREYQSETLRKIAGLAAELDLPLNVHSRSAGHYTIDLLLEAGASRVLMHAFDGRASHALRAVEAGFLFSIPPSIVRSEQKQKLVRRLPLEALVLETDSPVLGPEKGARNEPANIRLSAEWIATLKEVPVEQVRRTTTENAQRLFALEVAT